MLWGSSPDHDMSPDRAAHRGYHKGEMGGGGRERGVWKGEGYLIWWQVEEVSDGGRGAQHSWGEVEERDTWWVGVVDRGSGLVERDGLPGTHRGRGNRGLEVGREIGMRGAERSLCPGPC